MPCLFTTHWPELVTRDAMPTLNHKGTGKGNTNMQWWGARYSEWTAVMTASVFMTKCSEKQKNSSISFPYVLLPSVHWNKQQALTAGGSGGIWERLIVACLRIYLIMPALGHIDELPEWIATIVFFILLILVITSSLLLFLLYPQVVWQYQTW